MQSYCSSGKDHDPNEFSFDDTDGVAMMDYMNDDEQTGEDDLEDEANGTGESSGGGWVRRRRPHYAGRQQQRGHSNARYHHGSVMAADGDEDSLQGAEWSDQVDYNRMSILLLILLNISFYL
ncbi:unnamed protein product [Protopolystoma xenopodis]|uniref:Uncharacterized protein n=1 Tax=Protopolystoma xenopodis TaxID=117903 RepID=A0A448WY27_9PLAT|nr:unnamed protein product [Protopolystoma xenopodis]